jgi:NAD(P)-dependent dehydrogenase (short-subunit alcohol dehydrogenase family)
MSVIVVTGASGGVGRAVARLFAGRGDQVALIARGADGLAGAAADVQAAGGMPLPLQVDVADYDALDGAAATIEDQLGPIDVWINNAFSSVFATFQETKPEEFRRTTEVTYLGYVYGTRAALDRMRPRDRGAIVQVGSALAYRGIPLQSAYCGAKHAIQGFTESLRCELLHERSPIRVTSVHLPAVNTPQFAWLRSRMPRAAQPVPPIYEPEVAARAIVWAAEHAPRDLDVGWPTVLSRLTQAIVPGLMDRYVARSAWRGQQTEDPEVRGRPDNLERPVRARVGARGTFSGRATSSSLQLWAATHRGLVAAGVLAVTSLGGIARRLGARRGRGPAA